MPPCRCILSKFYIKPQRKYHFYVFPVVVSYRNSTSNHNSWASPILLLLVVSYRNSTSNHNLLNGRPLHLRLYLIEILHQTTTCLFILIGCSRLYLIEILHQTTTAGSSSPWPFRCILSKFYIKPQQATEPIGIRRVVSYRNSTSNHNSGFAIALAIPLYLIEILHQTTTCGKCEECLRRCILSKFYIKPQHGARRRAASWVVSYRNSTSNHNSMNTFDFRPIVVSYRNSTSNHNNPSNETPAITVVSYRNSTSNHN